MKSKPNHKQAGRPPQPKDRTQKGFGLKLWRWEWLIVLAALLCDFNSWGHQFVMDDNSYIFQKTEGLFRPLTQWSFAANLWIFGPNPNGFHLINRLLQIFICLTVLWIIRRLIPSRPLIAPLTALFFAVHPAQVEAVTYIQGRADELAMLFFMLAWFFYIRMRQSSTNEVTWYVGSAACFLFAMLSKENGVTWVGVAVLTELVYLSKGDWRDFASKLRQKLWKPYAGYLGVVLGYLIARYISIQTITAEGWFHENPLIILPRWAQTLTALKIVFLYIGQFFWPISFSPDYSYNQIPLFTHWNSTMAISVMAGVLFVVLSMVYSFRRFPNIFFGLAFFLTTISVVSNVILTIGAIRADRFLYLPSVGLCLVVATAISYLQVQLSSKQGKAAMGALVGVILILLTVRTIQCNVNWKDEFTLYLHAVKISPNSVKVRTHLGWEYYSRHESELSLEQYKAAEVIDPKYPELYANMGALYLQMGKIDEAIETYERALALHASGTDWIRINLGSALRKKGDIEGALHQYDLAIQASPSSAPAHFNKGNALYAQGKIQEAIQEYTRALELDPQMEAARTNLNALMNLSGKANTPSPPK